MLSIILPVYNEENAILPTIERIKEVMNRVKTKYEIIAVNDGSTDNTGEILKKIKGVDVILHPYNLGYGASLKNGIKKAKYDLILITDADGTYPIGDIPKLLKYSKTYDMVVGARTGKNVNVPLMRRPAKFFLRHLANFMTGRKIPDINSGFRIFKKDIALRFFHLFPSGFSFTTTITLACLTNDYTVKYIPINYYKRKGKSTINPLKDFINFTTLIFRMMMYFNPLKVFLFPSVLLFIFGFLILLYDIFIGANITDSSIIILLAAFQIGFLGLLADLIVKGKK